MKLEKCINQLNVLTLRVLTPQQEKCKYACTDQVKLNCNGYHAYSPSCEIPIRKGKICYELQKR